MWLQAFRDEISSLQNTVTQLTENLDDVTQQKQTIQELKNKLESYHFILHHQCLKSIGGDSMVVGVLAYQPRSRDSVPPPAQKDI